MKSKENWMKLQDHSTDRALVVDGETIGYRIALSSLREKH